MIIEWHNRFVAGDIVWIVMAAICAFVLLWPGWTLFYYGLLGKRSLWETRNTTRKGLSLLAVLSIVWCLWGYSLAFAPSWGTMPTSSETAAPVYNTFQEITKVADADQDETDEQGRGGVIGGSEYLGLRQMAPHTADRTSRFPTRRPFHNVPHALFLFFHMMLFIAVPTPLIVVLAERIRWWAVLLFAVLWGTAVYAPLVHWVWGDGWLKEQGALDFSGGLLQIGVGFSALAWTFGSGRLSADDHESPAIPKIVDQADRSVVGLGTLLLWAGAVLVYGAVAMKPNGQAVGASLNSHLAASAGLLAWVGTAQFIRKQTHSLDYCAGVIAGLAAIAAGSGVIVPQSAIVVGIAAGICGCLTFESLHWLQVRNEAWTVFVLQGITGTLGVFLTGVFATSSMAGADRHGQMIAGLVEGYAAQVGLQGIAVAATAAWSVTGTLLILVVIRLLGTFCALKPAE